MNINNNLLRIELKDMDYPDDAPNIFTVRINPQHKDQLISNVVEFNNSWFEITEITEVFLAHGIDLTISKEELLQKAKELNFDDRQLYLLDKFGIVEPSDFVDEVERVITEQKAFVNFENDIETVTLKY